MSVFNNVWIAMLVITMGPILFGALLFALIKYRWSRRGTDLKRPWQIVAKDAAYPLGYLTYDDALMKAAKLGKVGYVDFDYGIIFINLPGHSGEAPPDASGIR